MTLAHYLSGFARAIVGTPKLPRGIVLQEEWMPAEDWRVSGVRRGRVLVSRCTCRSDADREAGYMRGTGWHGVRVRRAKAGQE
jgi:hypothetical protein